MTGTTLPERRRPPGRYDDPPKGLARGLSVVVAVLFLGFLVAIAWSLYDRFGADGLLLRERGFEVQGDDAVRVEFEVSPPAGETVWCLVRARSAPGLEVGREFVPVRGDGSVVRVDHTLETTDRAVSGEVPRCRDYAPADGEPVADPVGP